jgi:hypothetical protein
VHSAPAIPNIEEIGETSFCEGGFLTLSADFSEDDHQWMNENGPMTGETGTSMDITNSGVYYLQLSNANGCAVSTDPITVEVIPNPAVPVIETENYTQDSCKSFEDVILTVETLQSNVNYLWIRNTSQIGLGPTLQGNLTEAEYKVQADYNGCISESSTLIISYADMPDVPAIISEGPTIWYLACDNENGSDYNWYYNGSEIVGANDYVYIAGTNLGKYEVAVSENSSCYAKSLPHWIPEGTTGIEAHPFANLQIYPNPTPGLFTLEMDNQIMGELIIDIFGETGQQIINIKFQKETSHFKTQIDLSGQPSALYLINLMLNEYRVTKSLVVE